MLKTFLLKKSEYYNSQSIQDYLSEFYSVRKSIKVENILKYVLRSIEVFDITTFVIFETSQKIKVPKIFLLSTLVKQLSFLHFFQKRFFVLFEVSERFTKVFQKIDRNKIFEIS